MFSRPVSSGWIPLRISMSEAIRPVVETRPAHGCVIREMSLRVVDFPPPFAPITPTASPSLTENDTSASAHTYDSAAPPRFSLSKVRDTSPASVRLWLTCFLRPPSRYRFHTWDSSTTGGPSDDIGEPGVETLVQPVAADGGDRSDHGRGPDRSPGR